MAWLIDSVHEPNDLGEHGLIYLYDEVAVAGTSESFVESDESAEFADVFVLLIWVLLYSHEEYLFEETLDVDVIFEFLPETPQNVGWLYSLKYAHQVVKDDGKVLLRWYFRDEPVDSELVLI